MTRQPRSGWLALVPAFSLLTGGCVINVDADHVVVREDQRFAVGAGADVTLETFDGSIRALSWSQPAVSVEIQKRGPDREAASALEVRSSQDGNRVRVEAPPPRVARERVGIGRFSGPSVSFLVRLPEQATLTAITRDGSIVVETVNGTVNLRSGDGSIRAEAVTGDITARTDDGSIVLVDVDGRVSLESGDGSLRVDGRVEHLQARTRDGSIVIEADEGSAMQDDWDVSTGDGSITLRVPRDFNAEIDADSRDGRVRTEMAGLEASRDERRRGTLRGRIGNGGHTVTLRSGDGSISVLNR
ncbi:MAG: DUF4097 family beta strand repeat-containing protein [Vicinamibacterales bacterium]